MTDTTDEGCGNVPREPAARPTRTERLQAELRDNLKRRKQQARARRDIDRQDGEDAAARRDRPRDD